jgi:hypothetical protein
MSYQLISKTLPEARKEHKCIWCGEQILIGEIHVKEVGEYDGEFQSNRYHNECHNAAHEYFKESNDDCFSPYDNKHGSTIEKSVAIERFHKNLCVLCGKGRLLPKMTICEECNDKAHNPENKTECNICSGGGSPVCNCGEIGVENKEEITHIPTSKFLEMKKKLDDYNDWLHLFVEIGDGGNLFDSLHKKYGDKYKIAYGWRTEGKCAESETLDDGGKWLEEQLTNITEFENHSEKSNLVVGDNKIPCPCITSNSKCNYACPCGDSVMSGVCVNCHNTGTILKSILKKPSEWQKEMPEVIIWDSDGWRLPDAKDWNEPITRAEYLTRRSFCTCKFDIKKLKELGQL